jgi:adenylate kinase
MKPLTFVFIGRSGAGKGTQFELLKKYLASVDTTRGQYVAVMGDIFRGFFKADARLAHIARDITNKGGFQPDFFTSGLFVSHIAHTLPEDTHIFIDGFPRSVEQLHALNELAEYAHLENIIYINIEVEPEEVKRRLLSRGRTDDTVEGITKRLSEYDRTVVPLIQKLEQSQAYTYLEIDGNRSIQDIHEDIKSKLAPYLA